MSRRLRRNDKDCCQYRLKLTSTWMPTEKLGATAIVRNSANITRPDRLSTEPLEPAGLGGDVSDCPIRCRSALPLFVAPRISSSKTLPGVSSCPLFTPNGLADDSLRYTNSSASYSEGSGALERASHPGRAAVLRGTIQYSIVGGTATKFILRQDGNSPTLNLFASAPDV